MLGVVVGPSSVCSARVVCLCQGPSWSSTMTSSGRVEDCDPTTPGHVMAAQDTVTHGTKAVPHGDTAELIANGGSSSSQSASAAAVGERATTAAAGVAAVSEAAAVSEVSVGAVADLRAKFETPDRRTREDGSPASTVLIQSEFERHMQDTNQNLVRALIDKLETQQKMIDRLERESHKRREKKIKLPTVAAWPVQTTSSVSSSSSSWQGSWSSSWDRTWMWGEDGWQQDWKRKERDEEPEDWPEEEN